MSRMLLSTGGTIIGTAIAGPIGGAIGGALGSIAGALLFPPPPTYGPRLDDTKVAPGTYGSPIGICYGISDFQADLIWVEGDKIKEVKTKQSAGAKGGGPTHNTYQYFATFAVLVCDSEIAGVRRVYAGKDLIFDGTADALEAAIASGGTLPLTGAVEGVTMRVYKGTATQNPDPSIQAEDPNAPAWRGMAYLVFEDLPLENYGQQIPPIFVEVVQAGAVGRPSVGLTPTGSAGGNSDAFDPSRGRMVTATINIAMNVYDMLGGRFERTDNLEGLPNLWKSAVFGDLAKQADMIVDAGGQRWNRRPPCIAPDGSFYVVAGEDQGANSIRSGWGVVVDAESGAFLSMLSTAANADGSFSYGFVGRVGEAGTETTDQRLRQVDWLPLNPLTGVQPYLYLRASEAGVIHFGPVSFADRGTVDCPGAVFVQSSSISPQLFADVNRAGDRLFVVYRSNASGSPIVVGRAALAGLPSATQKFADGAVSPDLTVTVDSGLGKSIDCVYNTDADTFAAICENGVAVYDADLNLVGQTINPGLQIVGARGVSGHIDGGRVWFSVEDPSTGAVANTFRSISTETGEVLEIENLGDWGLSDEVDIFNLWRIRSDIWVGYAGFLSGGSSTFEQQPFILFGDRWATPKVPLADVLQDAAERSGMNTADLDLTAVSRQIYGAPQKAGNVTARGIWEDLLLHTGHDAMMLDGVLTVRPRATTSDGTIDEDDLGADGGPAWLRRTNPSTVLRRVEVTYKSIKGQLEEASQSDEFPVDVAPDGELARFQTVLVMDDDEAWEDTQRLLVTGASERTEFEIALPYTRGDIEPADIWTLSADGASHDMRVSEIDGGAVLKLKGTAAWPFLAPAGTPIDSTRDAPVLAEIPATDFALIDSHIWRDPDDSAAFHLVAWPRRNSAAWDGGTIFRGTDPIVIADEFATISAAATVGAAHTVLGDVVSPNVWDRANSLTISMLSDTPQSAAEADVLNEANAVWIECGSTGEWELIQYANAVENADSTWTLSDFLRGRRGTEHLTGSHAIGDRLIWADTTTTKRVGGSAIGSVRYYVAASIGSSQNETTKRALTNQARALRPYSVVRVEGSRDGSGNLTITWVRRTRIHGDVSKTTVPLGETSEAYEVDIMDGSTVVRTITGLTSPSASYTAADQTTDFGATQASVTVRVYQLSDTVGRGVVKEATV